MATNLRSRIDRLEQYRAGFDDLTLFITQGAYGIPDDSLLGFDVDGTFYTREAGETICAAYQRIIDLVSEGRQMAKLHIHVLTPVLSHPDAIGLKALR